VADIPGGSKFGPNGPDGPTPPAIQGATSPSASTSGSATASPVQPLVVQPRFSSQLQQISRAMGTNVNLQRGYMIWADQGGNLGYTGGELGDGRDMINFLYNPSTVSSDYNVGNASLQAAMMYTVPGDSGNLLAPLLQQTVSFQLYFDRTFELTYGGNYGGGPNDPTVIGVQADIYQFMQFTGVNAALNKGQAAQAQNVGGNSASSSASSASGTAGLVTSGGIMMMIPSYVFFGNALAQIDNGAGNVNLGALASQLNYYGFISEWSPTYTHWTSNMVPIRASISVTFTMLPTPPAATQNAVWKDLQQLGKQPYTVATPLSPTTGLPVTAGNQPGVSLGS
jgi:hypothetical protein